MDTDSLPDPLMNGSENAAEFSTLSLSGVKRPKLDLDTNIDSSSTEVKVNGKTVSVGVGRNEVKLSPVRVDAAGDLRNNGDAVDSDLSSDPDQDFVFPQTSPSEFVKESKYPSVDEIMEDVSTTRFIKSTYVVRADICPRIHRPELTKNADRIKGTFGFEINGKTYLWAEEALYLLETGKLEIYCDEVVLSAERARSLFLHPKSDDPEAHFRTCGVDEYSVFKYLAKLGYRVRRKTEELSRPGTNQEEEEQDSIESEEFGDDEMDLDSDASNDTVVLGNATTTKTLSFKNLKDLTSQSQRTADQRTRLKRKATEPLRSVPEGNESESSDSSMKEAIVEDDSDCEFLESVENEGKTGLVEGDSQMSISECEEPMVEDDEPAIPGPSSRTKQSKILSAYTVVEADSDSDLEIVDEVIHSHCGVGIEEIGYDYGDTDLNDSGTEPGPSTSSSSKVIVDLVSSDSEQDASPSYGAIWSQLVPNANVKMSFPPSWLLPQNIPCQEDNDGDYDFRNIGDKSDLELESIVDGLRLDASPPNQPLRTAACSSWKQWRQEIMSEARDLINVSLLGSESKKFKNRLYQWKTAKEQDTEDTESLDLNIPFYIYPPSVARISKRKLGTEVMPIYQVAIVRDAELVPKLSDTASREADIPILFAVVSDNCDILFLAADSTPLTSLF